jgi:hypothetical protein
VQYEMSNENECMDIPLCVRDLVLNEPMNGMNQITTKNDTLSQGVLCVLSLLGSRV